MSESEKEAPKAEDLLWDGKVLKSVKTVGKPGPRPEWGDRVTLKYWLREEGDVNPDTMEERQTRILRMRRQWIYHVGDDDQSFLPRRLGEVILMSMAVGEQARFSISTECFTASEPWPEAPWLLAGTGGFERVDVERVVYEIQLLALSKGERPVDIGEPLEHCGRPAVTKRRPLRETGVVVSLPDPKDLEQEASQRVAAESARKPADMGDEEVLRGLLEQSAQQQDKARRKEAQARQQVAKVATEGPGTSKTLAPDPGSCSGAMSTMWRAKEVPGPHPGSEYEEARQFEAEEAAKAASRRSRLALSQAAGRSWQPWGDGAHPLSTWNKIQETKEAAALSQGPRRNVSRITLEDDEVEDATLHRTAGSLLLSATLALPQRPADLGAQESLNSTIGTSRSMDETIVSTSHVNCVDHTRLDVRISPITESSTELDRPQAEAPCVSNLVVNGLADASTNVAKSKECPHEFDTVKVRIEAQDHWGSLLLPRQTLEYVHGLGEQADCIEMAVGCMDAGESCDVQCHSRAALVGGPSLLKDPWLPASFRLFLESFEPDAEFGASPVNLTLQQRMCWAGKLRRTAVELQRRGRHYLARRLYLRILAAIGLGAAPLGDVGRRRAVAELRRHCLVQTTSCELKLELASSARASADALLKEHGPSACALTLRGRALLGLAPPLAVADFREVLRLDPASGRAQRLLQRAQQQVKQQRRAQKWFDGRGIETRTAEANDKQVCVQCNRFKPGGRIADDGSKWDGQYFCSECWECWVKIRRCQQRELDRRVDQAVHSDYSTHTDELPSLDDEPKEWDALHPMWARPGEKQAWQLAHIGGNRRHRIVASNEEREARLEAARHTREAVQAEIRAVADAEAAERASWERLELGLGCFRGAYEGSSGRTELLAALRTGGAAAEVAVAEVIGV